MRENREIARREFREYLDQSAVERRNLISAVLEYATDVRNRASQNRINIYEQIYCDMTADHVPVESPSQVRSILEGSGGIA